MVTAVIINRRLPFYAQIRDLTHLLQSGKILINDRDQVIFAPKMFKGFSTRRTLRSVG